MYRVLSREEVRAVDADAVARLKIPSLLLMENAGRGAFSFVRERFGQEMRSGPVVLVGGPGQNGGDAWVVARHLAREGVEVQAVLVGEASKLNGDALTNWRVLGESDVSCIELGGASAYLAEVLATARLVVDGLFGTGLARPVTGIYAEVVALMNAAAAPVVALDIPSGVDCDTGGVWGCAVNAQATVTFAAHKPGLLQYPGATHAGEVVLADIGTSDAVGELPGESLGDGLWAVTRDDLRGFIASRPADSHKGSAGRVLCVGGSPGRSGAVVLASLASLRAGAGLVSVLTHPDVEAVVDASLPEVMVHAWGDGGQGMPPGASWPSADGGAVVLGPGMGTDDLACARVAAVLNTASAPVVLDADAIACVALQGDGGFCVLRGASVPVVLTPHPGEAARLLRCSTEEIQRDRVAAVHRLRDLTGQWVVLKGARSLIAGPAGGTTICLPGTPAMGVAGTGDVLTGVVAARLADRTTSVSDPVHVQRAVVGAVLWHALAGVAAARGDRGLLASELAHALPGTLHMALTA